MQPQQQQQESHKQNEQDQQGQNNQNQEMQQQEDYDDLEDLGLFHKSSLRAQEELNLPQVVPQVFNAQRSLNENNQMHIQDYLEMEKLGQGAFADVKRVKKGNQFYAMKVYGLMKLKSRKFYAADGNFADSQEMFRNQVEILKRISHQNLARCHQILYGGNYAYVVMQLCNLGQIMDWSQEKNNFIRNPKVQTYLSTKYNLQSIQDLTRLIFLQVALGLQFLHKNNISNRDIKVDNILCKQNEPSGQDIKIADFTTVRYSKDDISYFTCGTAGFRSPEVQNAGSEGYSCKALDIWSFGISLYSYYYDGFPFMGESEYEIQNKVANEQLAIDTQCPQWLRQVVIGTTNKNGKERMEIEKVVEILSGVVK